jgi:P4 family phage/plasmid primase-like protien
MEQIHKTVNHRKNSHESDAVIARFNQFIEPLEVNPFNEKKTFNHVSMTNAKCQFDLPHNMFDDFYALYVSMLPHTVVGIAEIQQEYAQVMVDIDIRVPPDQKQLQIMAESKQSVQMFNTLLYTQADIKNIITQYFELFRTTLVKCDDDNMLYAFVLEKKNSYIQGGVLKCGIHIHFPRIIMSVHDVYSHIHSHIETKFKIDNLNGTPLLLYGSRKSDLLEQYRLTHIYSSKFESISLNAFVDKFPSYRNRINKHSRLSHAMTDDELLVRILSVFSHTFNNIKTSDCKLKLQIEAVTVKPYKPSNTSRPTRRAMPLSEIPALVSMLSVERSDDRDMWLEVGFVLHNIYDGSLEGFREWVRFSQITSKQNCFSLEKCMYLWDSMIENAYTVGTLRYMAKNDSPNEYEQFCADLSRKLATRLPTTEAEYATLLFASFGDNFKCSFDSKGKAVTWFYFGNHKWNIMSDGLHLRDKIETFLIPELTKVCIEMEREAAKVTIPDGVELSEEEIEKKKTTTAKKLTDVKKTTAKLLKSLNRSAMRNNIMTECKYKFNDESIRIKLDTNPYLMGFKNGVLDLNTLQFRDGKPDDYISKSTGYDFIPYDDFAMELNPIQNYLGKVFVDPELREYCIQYCAKLLKGMNSDKTFLILSGESGDNSKSILIELLEKVLGEYMIKLPTSLVTGKRSASSGCTPELVRLSGGVRFAILQEPDGTDAFNIGIIKELTGNDTMYVRGLFSEGVEIKPQLKMGIVCNKLPRVPTNDPAFWKRARVLTFSSQFLPKEQCPVTEGEQYERRMFPRNNAFSEWLDDLKMPMMWLMYKKFIEIATNKCRVHTPDKVTSATEAYRQENDIIALFVKNRLIEDIGEKITFDTGYSVFKEWSMVNYRRSVDRSEFIRFFERAGKVYQTSIKGYRLRDVKDDEISGDVLIIDEEEEESKHE